LKKLFHCSVADSSKTAIDREAYMNTTISLIVLIAVLAFVMVRPGGLPEAVAAVPAAALVVLLGLVPIGAAWNEVGALAPTVGFLAAVLILAHLADGEGVFSYAGVIAARWSRGSPQGLLARVFAIAATVTAALSLDATVVLLTPVIFATTATAGVRPRPYVYACIHLANSASLLLPVSNLTNLLAFSASKLTFGAYSLIMVAPWCAVVGIEYLIFRWYFARDLDPRLHPPSVMGEDSPGYFAAASDGQQRTLVMVRTKAPKVAIAVLVLTLLGFGLLQPLGVHPGFVALGGVAVLAARRLRGLRAGERMAVAKSVAAAANPAFLAFVVALGLVVLAVRRSGIGGLIARLVPHHQSFFGLLAVAVMAAILANVLNNLPTTLVLVPLVSSSPTLILAVLLGVNIGPNLTYIGSLATLLWRQLLHAHDHPPDVRDFLRLGALTVPACLFAGVLMLWLSLITLGRY
jgi:arsenical pump membrane protein